MFPSPCGVWVVSCLYLFSKSSGGFRPLAGCGLFLYIMTQTTEKVVSVPLRGVGCFSESFQADYDFWVSVPLRGVGCFREENRQRL